MVKMTTTMSEVLMDRFQLMPLRGGKVRSDSSSRRPKGPSMMLKLSAKVLLVTLAVVASRVIRCTMFGSGYYYEQRSEGDGEEI